MRRPSAQLTAEYLAHNTINKNIADIFKPVDESFSPRVVLIDGAPGIGKTYLCKEIAYQWSQGQILTDKRFLFLLRARDSRLQSLKHIKDLVALCCCDFENEEALNSIDEYIKETKGAFLTVVLDGYDEFPEELQSNHLLSRLIRCEILPKCNVVITSRSFACGSLYGQADRRMEILGFTSNDRQEYIEKALEKKPNDITRLKQYLESHPSVDSLCYIPLNMTILLHLFTENDLPYSRTELYEKFVNLTITLHIEKNGKMHKDVERANSFKGSIKQKLAHLSYDALRKDIVVFSSEEVTRACPEIMQNSGTIHGFGLLQATEHFTTDGGKTLSFNFAHLSVQEYLAASYIQSLPDERQLDLLKDTFWNERYLNTWIIYVGLTHGRSFAFKHFLCGNLTSKLFKEFHIAQKILKVKINRLRLFQCFKEANNEAMCNIIGESMQNKQVDLSGETLLPNHVVTLGFFLTQSYILEWERLDLSNCNMQDVGCRILWKELASSTQSKIHIKVINFSGNKLSAYSAEAVANLVQSCETEELYISDNQFDDEGAKSFSSLLSSDTSLKLLLMDGNNISTDVAEEVEQEITNTTSLNIVGITSDQLYVRNEPADHIAEVLKWYNTLSKFSMCNCPVDAEDFKAILDLLVENTNLHTVHLSHVGLARSMVKLQLSATKLSSLRHLSHLAIIEPRLYHVAADDLIDTVSITSSAKVVIVSDIKIHARQSTYLEITDCLKLNPLIMILDISKCLPNEEKFVDSLVTAIEAAPLMQEVDVSQNKLGTIGVQKIATAIKNMPRLKSLIMMGNDINDVAAKALADGLESKIGLETLNLSANKILSQGAIAISKSLQDNKILNVLNLQDNGIGLDAAPELSCMLANKTNLSELNLAQNSLKTEGMIIIAKALQNINTLKVLNVSSNNILTKASSDIAEVIKSNASLEVLNVSLNKLESLGCIKVCKALQKQHLNLRVFNISSNGVKFVAANEISRALQEKQKLEVVNVSWNEFEGGLATIVASLKSTKLF